MKMGLTSSAPQPGSKRLGYVPAVMSILPNAESMSDRKHRKGDKVLVIGAGCAGLGAAWHLNRAGVDVTLYESLDKLGGHANTITGKRFRRSPICLTAAS